MAKKTAPGAGLSYGWGLGESGLPVKEALDLNFLTTSVLLNLSVLSRTTNLPGSPADASVYIVPVGQTNANKVAIRTGSTWVYLTPKRNWEARVQDAADEKVVFNGTVWVVAHADLLTRIAALEATVATLGGG